MFDHDVARDQMSVNVEKFWTQVTQKPNAPKHRGGKVTTKKLPIPKPKVIRRNKPGIYWSESTNTLFIVYSDYSVEIMPGPNSWMDDRYFSPDETNGWTRNSDYDHYLGAL